MIFPLDWVDVSWNFREGGTFLGSARCPELKETTTQSKKLKEKALMNLYRHKISDLVIVGGDGSLTGGYALFSLLQNREYSNPALHRMKLSIVGIPGSIDNDIAYTDMSIGVDTTLNTIVESIDRLRDTATSHRRVIIVEVMGRRRGYLAVMSGLATGADRIFIREDRVSQSELTTLLHVLQKSFEQGQKAGIIVRAEGAPVSTTFLKETIAVLLEPKREVRETVLGHLQRGGNPTVFERTLATRMGVRAIQLLATNPAEPQLVRLSAKKISSAPLLKSLIKIQTPAFQEELSANTQTALHLGRKLEMPPEEKSRGISIGLLTDGTNVSGMNMAIRSVARLALNRGIAVKGIKGGFSGLRRGPESTVNLHWSMLEMKSILRRAGTLLGVSSSGFPLDEKGYGAIKKHMKQLKIDGLIVIGNTAAYRAAHRLSSLMNIPVVGIPAASHCNLPETDWVIGMDSTLNDLLQGIDRAADAAHVTRKIFIVHLKGEFCNCLVKLVALAGGAEQVLIDEHAAGSPDRHAFQKKVRNSMNELKKMIALEKTFATIVFYSRHPETADQTMQCIKQSLRTAGITLDTTIIPLETSLGGIIPTAFDRILAKRLGEKALETVLNKIASRDYSFHFVGIKGKEIVVPHYTESLDTAPGRCPKTLASELEHCFDLMAQPGALCIGMGGKVHWTATNTETRWRGKWTCKACGHSQTFSFNPRHMLCLYCASATCHNYGYIRISRRL